ncbi:hypothetical protein HD599_002151 [Conyzicola lurida]|uniref:DUF8094 domain-containing protein n=1 Tax=Conyzicola lurida TaxID=1172621 RepID=A0A841ANB1_9MICO|nr:hypothetical protein [Conyzicola lurida]MBB5843828.1 hypothetical protein [Conyzicola lurida]
MRFVLAIVSFVVAALLIGLGIAQKTILAAPDEVTAATSITTDAPVTVISGEALNANPRSQFVQLSDSDGNFAAYGRTTDVLAWVGEASYNDVTYDAETAGLTSTLVEGTETEVPTPVDSDLWLASYSNTSSFTVNVPEDISLLVVTDGVQPAPAEISVTWPVDNTTPWANTFVVAGGVLLLVGLLLLFWAIAHIRKGRGPRRKSQKMPKLPKQPRYKPIKSKPRELEANAKGRRSARVAIIPALLITGLALSGCSADFWAGRQTVVEPSATADPLADAEEAEQFSPPAVTEEQAKRIVADLSEVTTAADAALDIELAGTRLAGPALEARTFNYTARTADATVPAIPAIPSGPIEVTLPQQSDGWPRAVFAVISDSGTDANGQALAPVAVTLIQDDPRSNYKAQYVMRLQPGVVTPDVAPASVGATRFRSDSPLLTIAPGEIAADYADVLLSADASASYPLFDNATDTVQEAYGVPFKLRERGALEATSTLDWTTTPATGPVVALSTNDSGAIVSVNVNEITTAKVVEAGATVKPKGATKAVVGKADSGKGFAVTYGFQLLFFVPSVEQGGTITLLGYAQNPIAASELP